MLLLAAAFPWLPFIAQAAGTPPDISPIAYWGVAGFLLSTLLTLLVWLLVQERNAHQALQTQVLSEYLPALIASTNQQRDTTKALTEISSRPNVDPHAFEEWKLTMSRIKDRLDADDARRARSR